MAENNAPTISLLERVEQEYEKYGSNRCNRLTFIAKLRKCITNEEITKFHTELFSNEKQIILCKIKQKKQEEKEKKENQRRIFGGSNNNSNNNNSNSISTSSSTNLGEFKQQKQQQQQIQTTEQIPNQEKITGSFIIVNEEYVIHTFEYYAEIKLQEYLSILNKKNFFVNSRVLSVIQFMPREYKNWFCRNCTLAVNSEDKIEGEDDQNVILRIMQSLIELGNQLSIKEDYESANRLFLSNTRGILNKIPNLTQLKYVLEKMEILFPLKKFYPLIFGAWDFEIASEYLYPANCHPVETLLENIVLKT